MSYEEMLSNGMDIFEAKMFSSIFFVEATHTEQFYLWKEYNKITEWVQDNEGYIKCVGYIDGIETLPVNVTFNYCTIFGKRVCFYESTGRYTDYILVEEYIKTRYPKQWDNNTRLAMTDAMNFHHAIDCVKRG